MRCFIQIDAQGRVLFCSGLSGSITLVSGYHPSTHKELPAPPEDINLVYWDGWLRYMPERPSEHHQFDYTSKSWVLNLERAWSYVRGRRDNALTACDWVTLRAQEQGTPAPQEWLDYRQALRDITNQSDPLAIIWPVAPSN